MDFTYTFRGHKFTASGYDAAKKHAEEIGGDGSLCIGNGILVATLRAGEWFTPSINDVLDYFHSVNGGVQIDWDVMRRLIHATIDNMDGGK